MLLFLLGMLLLVRGVISLCSCSCQTIAVTSAGNSVFADESVATVNNLCRPVYHDLYDDRRFCDLHCRDLRFRPALQPHRFLDFALSSLVYFRLNTSRQGMSFDPSGFFFKLLYFKLSTFQFSKSLIHHKRKSPTDKFI